MRVFITGVEGFIGSALKQRLQSLKIDYKGSTRRLLASPRSNLVQIEDFEKLSPADNTLEAVDAVVHLANLASVPSGASCSAQEKLLSVNVKGTENLLRCAAYNNVKRFIYISSLKAVGERTEFQSALSSSSIPQPEDAYGKSKLAAEKTIQQLGPELGIEYVIIRPPMVYGPGVGANFGSLVKLVKRQYPLPFKAIVNRRSMVYVENLTDLIVTCLSHPGAADQIFMVSDNHDPSLPELVQSIAAGLQLNNPSFTFPVALLNLLGTLGGRRSLVDKLTGNLVVDMSHTEQTLNWQPPFTFKQGIHRSVAKQR